MNAQLNWKTILRESKGELGIQVCPESDIDDLILAAPQGITARVVRGQRCTDKERTLQEWAAALQFPSYFGGNWDALEECLEDLSWLGTDTAVVFVTHADAVLPKGGRDYGVLINLFTAMTPGSPLRIVLQCEPGSEQKLLSRLKKA